MLPNDSDCVLLSGGPNDGERVQRPDADVLVVELPWSSVMVARYRRDRQDPGVFRFKDYDRLVFGGTRRREMLDVLGDIADERQAQDAEWGGPEHDAQHSLQDFGWLIRVHLGRGEDAAGILQQTGRPGDTWRQQMIRVAALAAAAVESYDRRSVS